MSSSRIVKEEFTMTERSTHWNVHYPGEVYSNDIRLEIPMTEQEVRANEREVIGVKRLPDGIEFWIA